MTDDEMLLVDADGLPADVTRQRRFGNRMYLFPFDDGRIFKIGLATAGRALERRRSAVETLDRRGIDHGQNVDGWIAEIPFLDNRFWGDAQRFEMAVAGRFAVLAEAECAGEIGFQWFRSSDADVTHDELDAMLDRAIADAAAFLGYEDTGPVVVRPMSTTSGDGPTAKQSGAATRAHRTMRSKAGVCARSGCGEPHRKRERRADPDKLTTEWWYCSATCADDDGASEPTPATGRTDASHSPNRATPKQRGAGRRGGRKIKNDKRRCARTGCNGTIDSGSPAATDPENPGRTWWWCTDRCRGLDLDEPSESQR